MSLFPYYGGKGRLSRRYPRPHFDTIVEPFAGGANYSLLYPSKQVKLYDIDPAIVALWQYLLKVPTSRLLELPVLPQGARVSDAKGLCDEERTFLGMWAQPGGSSTGRHDNVVSKWGLHSGWGKYRLGVARQVEQIRHWTIEQRSWDAIDVGPRATWFIDPPYQGGGGLAGDGYTHGKGGVDFAALGSWVRALPGQVIACDHEDADWLPFRGLFHQHSQQQEWRTELVYLQGPQPMTGPLGSTQGRGRVTVRVY